MKYRQDNKRKSKTAAIYELDDTSDDDDDEDDKCDNWSNIICNNISWRYIWRTYYLDYHGVRLTDDNKLLDNYGIGNKSVLKFVKNTKRNNMR